MIDAVLCVDIGTTSLKAGLVTAEGEVVSVCKVKFNAAEDKYLIAGKWLGAFNSALQKLKEDSSCRTLDVQIKAVSISGNGPTVVTEDARTVLWNDSYELSPARCGTSLFLSKLITLKELFPREFSESRHIFSGPEYLIWQLTGAAVTILPEKRFEAAYWNDEILTSEGILPEKLPPFYKVGEVYGKMDGESFKDAGFFAEDKVPVFGAGPDFVAALIGTNTLFPGRICDRSGSSEGINFCLSSAVRADGIRTLPSVIPGLWNVSVLLPMSGRMPENQRIASLQKAVQLLKALALENGEVFPREMLVTGGQTKNPHYMERKAAALGMVLVEANCDDAELLGDACVAWWGLGRYGNLQEAAGKIVKEGKHYENI
ncbi:MAG: hypothetical protein IJ688_02090 [Treponema sp.]|nr:hypothetical protein [Treponema sp.]